MLGPVVIAVDDSLLGNLPFTRRGLAHPVALSWCYPHCPRGLPRHLGTLAVGSVSARGWITSLCKVLLLVRQVGTRSRFSDDCQLEARESP